MFIPHSQSVLKWRYRENVQTCRRPNFPVYTMTISFLRLQRFYFRTCIFGHLKMQGTHCRGRGFDTRTAHRLSLIKGILDPGFPQSLQATTGKIPRLNMPGTSNSSYLQGYCLIPSHAILCHLCSVKHSLNNRRIYKWEAFKETLWKAEWRYYVIFVYAIKWFRHAITNRYQQDGWYKDIIFQKLSTYLKVTMLFKNVLREVNLVWRWLQQGRNLKLFKVYERSNARVDSTENHAPQI
jgi:hypothetical protein